MIKRLASPKCALVSVALSLSAMTAAIALPQVSEPDLLNRFEAAQVFFRQFEIAEQLLDGAGPDSLIQLESWLQHEDRHIRANAAYVFAGLGDDRGLEVLYQILHDRSDRPLGQGIPGGNIHEGRWNPRQIEADRYYAVHVLGELKNPRALDELLPLLSDSEVNYKVAWALGEIGDPRAIPHLVEALRDSDPLVRTIAIDSLVKLQAVDARPYIEALLSDTALPRSGDQIPVGETARVALDELEER